jgi:hypothetical protein
MNDRLIFYGYKKAVIFSRIHGYYNDESYHTSPVQVPDMLKIIHYATCAIAVLCSPVCASDQALTSFHATYKLYSSGTEIAVINRTLTHVNNNEYIYRSESNATGIVSLFRNDHILEESLWRFEENKLYPLDYTYQHSGGKKDRDVNIQFDWNRHLIINRVNDHTWEMPLEAGVLDKLLYQYAIMFDLKNGHIPNTYTIADGGKIKTYIFERLGEETVLTPLGDLNTIKLLRRKQNDKRLSIFWCAPAYQYLPVKVEHTEEDGLKTTAVIESLTGF